MKWYKRDPKAALTGMQFLSLEERGAYNTLIDLIYARAPTQFLPDNDADLTHAMNADPRIWRRVKASLIAKGVIEIHDGAIHDAKADATIRAAFQQPEPDPASSQTRPLAKPLATPQLGPYVAPSYGPSLGADPKENNGLAHEPSRARVLEARNQKESKKERQEEPPDPQGGISVQGLTEILPSNIDLAFAAFRSMAERNALKVPTKLEADRRKLLESRLAQSGGVDEFRAVMDKIAASDKLCGRDPKFDFTLTIDWMLKPANWRKITEGNYDNRPTRIQSRRNPYVAAVERLQERMRKAGIGGEDN